MLLSISSLVMGEEEPAVNEPGWEREKGSKASQKYNKNLRRQTIRHGMLRQLQNLPAPWADVIKGHFKHKRSVLIEQLDQWLEEDDGNS